MAWMKQQWGIISAILLAIVMIGGSYFYAIGGFAPQQVDATSFTAALQTFTTKDSDGDGLPDWEETLYGTDPHKVDTFGLGMTDGEAVAKGLILPIAATPSATNSSTTQTFTDQTASSTLSNSKLSTNSFTALFAKDFFTAYLAAKTANGNIPPTKKQAATIALNIMQSISDQNAIANYRTLSQINVSGSGAQSLRDYAATTQKALSSNTLSENKWVPDYLQEAMSDSSTSTEALVHIRNISQMYTKGAAILAQISVPKEAEQAHLDLINAYAHMGTVTSHMAEFNTDPLITFLAITKYKTNILSLARAYVELGKVFRTAGITLAPGTPGASFVNVATDAATGQKTSATTSTQ